LSLRCLCVGKDKAAGFHPSRRPCPPTIVGAGVVGSLTSLVRVSQWLLCTAFMLPNHDKWFGRSISGAGSDPQLYRGCGGGALRPARRISMVDFGVVSGTAPSAQGGPHNGVVSTQFYHLSPRPRSQLDLTSMCRQHGALRALHSAAAPLVKTRDTTVASRLISSAQELSSSTARWLKR